MMGDFQIPPEGWQPSAWKQPLSDLYAFMTQLGMAARYYSTVDTLQKPVFCNIRFQRFSLKSLSCCGRSQGAFGSVTYFQPNLTVFLYRKKEEELNNVSCFGLRCHFLKDLGDKFRILSPGRDN